MRQYQTTLAIETQPRRPVAITRPVAAVVEESGIRVGLCTVFLRHTSASLLIQENADPTVLDDLSAWLADLAPESRPWRHDAEGPDDMPAHAKAALLRASEAIPIAAGELQLGTWQGIFVLEHRSRRHVREVVVHIVGE